jgi:type VI secretion system secreted protein VgrG
MADAEAQEILFKFQVNGMPPDKFALVRMEGREALSELYRFDLDLVSDDPDIDPEKIVNQPAVVAIDRDDDVTLFHGIITQFEQRGMGPEFVDYHMVLVPRVYNLGFTKQCQIFMEKPVKTIISDVLTENGMSEGTDFDISLKETYPDREYTVQYQESDLDFIMRLMEHEGIFFFFEHGEEQEKLIISDKKEAHQPIAGDPKVPFRDARAINPAGEAVGTFTFRQQQLSKQIILKDYNYRKPTLEIKGEASVIEKGFGTFMEYGNHFKDPDDGARLARMRAEEQSCRQKLFFGQGAVRHFRSGATFELIDHFRSANNGKYLLTAVQHSGTQPGVIGTAYGSGAEKPGYLNTFEAIPAAIVFRPLRVTPRPVIHGVTHGFIDSATSGDYADIDDLGRYRVKLNFDISDAKDGKASRYMRMAQPYSGPDIGMHFPLLKGTEVLLIHLDGDPDRPLIVASVPNPDTMSPVTAANHTQCAINTKGGSTVTFEDQDGSQRIHMVCVTKGTSLIMGAPAPAK